MAFFVFWTTDRHEPDSREKFDDEQSVVDFLNSKASDPDFRFSVIEGREVEFKPVSRPLRALIGHQKLARSTPRLALAAATAGKCGPPRYAPGNIQGGLFVSRRRYIHDDPPARPLKLVQCGESREGLPHDDVG